MFYDNLKAACEEKGLKISPTVVECGGALGSISKWKNGAYPNSDIVIKLAMRLGVTTDYLLTGKEKSPNNDTQKENERFNLPPIEHDYVKYFNYSTFEEFCDSYKNGDISEIIKGRDFVYRGQSNDMPLLPSIMRYEISKGKRTVPRKIKGLLYGYVCDIDGKDYFQSLDIAKEFAYKLSEIGMLNSFYSAIEKKGIDFPVSPESKKEFTKKITTYDDMTKAIDKKWLSEYEDLAALAQHYGVPTRLLDWSFDLCVSLYFAAKGALQHIAEDGKIDENQKIVIWALEYKKIEPESNCDANGVHITGDDDFFKYASLIFVNPNSNFNPNCHAQKGILSYWQTPCDMFDSVVRKSLLAVDFDYTLNKYNERVKDKDKQYDLLKITLPVSESLRIFEFISRLGYTGTSLLSGYEAAKEEVIEKALITYVEKIIGEYEPIDNKYDIRVSPNEIAQTTTRNLAKAERSVTDLTEMEIEVLEIFNKLTKKDQLKFIGRMEQQYEEYATPPMAFAARSTGPENTNCCPQIDPAKLDVLDDIPTMDEE